MPSVNRRAWLSAAGVALVGGGLEAARASAQTATAKVASVPGAKAKRTPRERIRDRNLPNLLLTTHEGKQVRFYDDLVKDKIVLINMMYAECQGICPGISANLAKVYKKFGKRMGRDIMMISITLRPERDTPQALKHYAGMHKAGPGWVFLTGKPDDIELLRRRLGFVDPDPEVDKDKTTHIGNIRFGNEALMLWGACPGQTKPESIAISILEAVDWPKPEPAAKRKGGKG
ncbi:MAG TPA: SCO family protein [Pyrinomonadaceae bacterium]|nr:SCO family protein [Pyrinomonadaceae bacterium]